MQISGGLRHGPLLVTQFYPREVIPPSLSDTAQECSGRKENQTDAEEVGKKEQPVISLRTYCPEDLPALVALWNRCLVGTPNFIPLTEREFSERVVRAPGFRPELMLLAAEQEELVGYVHYGPRLEMWENGSLQTAPEEGHIYALVAPRENLPLQRALLEEATLRLADLGAGRVPFYPSWVCGTQSMYNGVAGAYEMPGLSDTRQELLEVAEGQGFARIAEYGTPELSLTDPVAEALRRQAREELWEAARALGLREETGRCGRSFLPTAAR